MKAGDIRQFVLGGREFDPASEADFEISLPGYDVENKPAGNGKMYGIGKRKLGGIDGAEVVIDNSRGDLEFLNDIKTAGLPVPVTLTHIDGSIWTGALAIEGELKYTNQSGTAKFALRGEKWEQI